MAEVPIVREDIIVVDHAELDTYGNLSVIDKAGGEHRVNKKHESLHPIFRAGMAVKVGYGNYMNKEFIHTAVQVKGELPVNPPAVPREAPKPDARSAEIAQHVWWKELGECLRTKEIDKTTPTGKALRKAYYAQMFSILDIKIEDKEH